MSSSITTKIYFYFSDRNSFNLRQMKKDQMNNRGSWISKSKIFTLFLIQY